MGKLWITFAVLVAAGCGQSPPPPTPPSADEAFIAQLRKDAYWANTDSTKAIAAAHAVCDTIANANQFHNSGESDMITTLTSRYGFGPATTLRTAAEQNYCPGTSHY